MRTVSINKDTTIPIYIPGVDEVSSFETLKLNIDNLSKLNLQCNSYLNINHQNVIIFENWANKDKVHFYQSIPFKNVFQHF